jgi:hypothetical protein
VISVWHAGRPDAEPRKSSLTLRSKSETPTSKNRSGGCLDSFGVIKISMPTHSIALIGDYDPDVVAHRAIPSVVFEVAPCCPRIR